jgi:hypothetical protein
LLLSSVGKAVPLGAVIVMVPLFVASAPVALVVACTVQIDVVAPCNVDGTTLTLVTDVVGVLKFNPGLAKFAGSAIEETEKSDVVEKLPEGFVTPVITIVIGTELPMPTGMKNWAWDPPSWIKAFGETVVPFTLYAVFDEGN